jgi:hypothetical protein
VLRLSFFPQGVNIMQFCKEYNAATQDKAGMIIPVEITVYEDRSFTFVLKTPPASGASAPPPPLACSPPAWQPRVVLLQAWVLVQCGWTRPRRGAAWCTGLGRYLTSQP